MSKAIRLTEAQAFILVKALENTLVSITHKAPFKGARHGHKTIWYGQDEDTGAALMCVWGNPEKALVDKGFLEACNQPGQYTLTEAGFWRVEAYLERKRALA